MAMDPDMPSVNVGLSIRSGNPVRIAIIPCECVIAIGRAEDEGYSDLTSAQLDARIKVHYYAGCVNWRAMGIE